VRLKDGTVLLKDVAVTREPDEIYFTEPFEENYAPRKGDIYAFGIRGKEVLDLVITDIQPGADLSATLTCVEYSPEIFRLDDPDYVLPPFDSKVSPVSGAVDSGVVGPARWHLFVTYHDAALEPQRPQGDGQGGGWHYAHTAQAVWQSSKSAETVDSGEWGAPVRIKAERGNTDTVAFYLALSPQSIILETDSGGALIAGQLPFTVRADLFKWNYKIPVIAGIRKFPGGGGNLFDPMLGDFYPAGRGIAFSLVDAPAGVTVNDEGVITVAANAALEGEHSVTVRAAYRGDVYSAVLFIQVLKKGLGEALYLGTVDTVPQDAYAYILKGPVHGRVRALQHNYVLAVAGGTVGSRIWKAGYVYQWTGVKWEERSPDTYTDLYIRCFKDGLDAPGLARDMGWFGALFARVLIAQQAFIETLAAQLIVLRKGGAIQSESETDGIPDVLIKADGEAIFNKATIRGHVDANSGTFTDITVTGDSIFCGDIFSGPLVLTKEYPISGLISYGAGTGAIDIVNTEINRLGLSTTPPTGAVRYATGVYNGKEIAKISISYSRTGNTNTTKQYWDVKLTYRDGTSEDIANRDYYAGVGGGTFTNRVLSQTLSFRYTSGDRVFKLVGIGIVPGDAGVVYRDSNGFLKITL